MTDHSGNKMNSHACLLEFCEFVLKSMLMKNKFCLRTQLIVTSFIARFLKSENKTSRLDCSKFFDGTLNPPVSYAYMLCLKSDERRQRSFYFFTTASYLMFRAVIDKFSQKSTIYIYGCWIKMFYLIRYVRSLQNNNVEKWSRLTFFSSNKFHGPPWISAQIFWASRGGHGRNIQLRGLRGGKTWGLGGQN